MLLDSLEEVHRSGYEFGLLDDVLVLGSAWLNVLEDFVQADGNGLAKAAEHVFVVHLLHFLCELVILYPQHRNLAFELVDLRLKCFLHLVSTTLPIRDWDIVSLILVRQNILGYEVIGVVLLVHLPEGTLTSCLLVRFSLAVWLLNLLDFNLGLFFACPVVHRVRVNPRRLTS